MNKRRRAITVNQHSAEKHLKCQTVIFIYNWSIHMWHIIAVNRTQQTHRGGAARVMQTHRQQAFNLYSDSSTHSCMARYTYHYYSSFILHIYIALLQENLLRSAPNTSTAKKSSMKLRKSAGEKVLLKIRSSDSSLRDLNSDSKCKLETAKAQLENVTYSRALVKSEKLSKG